IAADLRVASVVIPGCAVRPRPGIHSLLAVSEVRLALPNFYNIAIRIANVAARLAVLVLWLRDKLGSSASPQLIAGLNIGNADIHKAVDGIGIGGSAECYRGFVGCRAAPDVDNEPRVRDLNVTRRALAIASAQNATTEDRFVKSKRSLDIGDGEKVCDGDAFLRRHLIAFLLDLYLVHRRLRMWYFSVRPNRSGSILILSPVRKLRDMAQGATGWLDGRLRTPTRNASHFTRRDVVSSAQ